MAPMAAAEAVRFHRAHQDAWLESVFFRVHTRCAIYVSRAFNARARHIFEVLCALVAVCGLGQSDPFPPATLNNSCAGVLVGLHMRFATISTSLSDALESARDDIEYDLPRSQPYIIGIVVVYGPSCFDAFSHANSCETNDQHERTEMYLYSREHGKHLEPE